MNSPEVFNVRYLVSGICHLFYLLAIIIEIPWSDVGYIECDSTEIGQNLNLILFIRLNNKQGFLKIQLNPFCFISIIPTVYMGIRNIFTLRNSRRGTGGVNRS